MSVYTFLILILTVPCMGEAVRQTLFTGSADVDVMFDQCLINSMTVRSKLDCARCRQAESSALTTMQRQLSTAINTINTLCTELRLVRTELSNVKAECAALKQSQLQTHAEIQDSILL
nr:hypothetical protein BaRGS_004728 [Batillaria attramentaria]